MIVKCHVTQCVYNKELKCANKEIQLDDLGMCCSEISQIVSGGRPKESYAEWCMKKDR